MRQMCTNTPKLWSYKICEEKIKEKNNLSITQLIKVFIPDHKMVSSNSHSTILYKKKRERKYFSKKKKSGRPFKWESMCKNKLIISKRKSLVIKSEYMCK